MFYDHFWPTVAFEFCLFRGRQWPLIMVMYFRLELQLANPPVCKVKVCKDVNLCKSFWAPSKTRRCFFLLGTLSVGRQQVWVFRSWTCCNWNPFFFFFFSFLKHICQHCKSVILGAWTEFLIPKSLICTTFFQFSIDSRPDGCFNESADQDFKEKQNTCLVVLFFWLINMQI